jgi:hypothetical protein
MSPGATAHAQAGHDDIGLTITEVAPGSTWHAHKPAHRFFHRRRSANSASVSPASPPMLAVRPLSSAQQSASQAGPSSTMRRIPGPQPAPGGNPGVSGSNASSFDDYRHADEDDNRAGDR